VSAEQQLQEQRHTQRAACARCGSAKIVWFTPPSATYAGHIVLCARCHRLTIALSRPATVRRQLVGQQASGG
jgi:hypothetical protein